MFKDLLELINTGKMKSTDNWGTGVILQDPETKKILLAKRTDLDNPWASPGGKVEYSESPIDGICRECLEESNIALNTVNCYDYRLNEAPNGRPWIDFMFYSDNFDASNIINQETEMMPFEWFDIDEAFKLNLFEPCRAALERGIDLGVVQCCDTNIEISDTVPSPSYIPFVECPSSASSVKDSCCCAYSFEEPQGIFTTHQLMPWD